ncbi:MAG: hypothetical protein FWD26_01065 [Treponema sp.]|nr:hypothetical protein [Treponema sp.]
MSIFRSVLLVSLVSLLISLALLFLGYSMGYDELKSGYAVLTTDVSVEDKTLAGLLNIAGEPVSESSQWVMLDNFDSLEKVPLNEYFARVNYFDPRNDGYAEKLQEIFIRDGKRFIYVPLNAGSWSSAWLDNQFASLLADIPFSAEYYGIQRPLFLFFLMYAISCVCLLVICYVKKNSHGAPVIITLVPVLSSLAFFGAAGIVCAALFFALFIMLKEPLSEIVQQYLVVLKNKKQFLSVIKKEILVPYKYYFLLLPAFFLAFFIIAVFSQLKPIFLSVVFIASLFVFIFSLVMLNLGSASRRRFVPVLIVKRRLPDFAFSFYMLPFAVCAFITLFLSPYQTGAFDTKAKFDTYIYENDYHRHLAYQSSFSTSRGWNLMKPPVPSESFPVFFLDLDGLPSMKTQAQGTINYSDFPPFPLKHLMDFFHSVNTGQKTDSGPYRSGISEKLLPVLLLFFIIPVFFIKKENNYRFRRISTAVSSREFRLKDINWNKSTLYNEKNKRIQKEA